MAFATNQKYTENNNVNPTISIAPTKTPVGRLLAVSPAETYPRGTPMAFDTSNVGWVVWTDSGANGTGTIKGFMNEDTITTDTADNKVASIMTEGRILHDDVPVPSGETQDNLDTALKNDLMGRGLYVSRLVDAH